jgi:hypothetical protein
VPGARRELRIVGVTGNGAEKRDDLVRPERPTRMYTIRDSAACGPPNRVATRSTWNRPIKPQFNAPTITRRSVAMFITLINRLLWVKMGLSGAGAERHPSVLQMMVRRRIEIGIILIAAS